MVEARQIRRRSRGHHMSQRWFRTPLPQHTKKTRRGRTKGKARKEKKEPLPIFATILVLVLLATFGWFLAVFTRRLSADTAAEYGEITPMVRFCYFFTLLAFALAVAPPFVARLLPQAAYRTMVRSPVGIVKGCVHTTTQSDWELACSKDDPFKIQWLFNIGGSARYRVPRVPPVAVPANAPADDAKDRSSEQIETDSKARISGQWLFMADWPCRGTS
jgi:hypothetical protein